MDERWLVGRQSFLPSVAWLPALQEYQQHAHVMVGTSNWCVVVCTVQRAAVFGVKHFDPDETRTRNLLIRSQTPYPLGHEAMSRCSPSPHIRPLLVRDLASLQPVPSLSPDIKSLGAGGTDWWHLAHLFFAKTPPTPGIEPGPPA